jgi:uncharacterized protein YeaO (DUF488 family)
MFTIKHFLDACEPGDGQRIWIEPIPLTADLREWCKVDHLACALGPPLSVWRWFQQHPDGYEYFRCVYHEYLERSAMNPALAQLAAAASCSDLTLLHQGDDPAQNTATALYEYLTNLSAYLDIR